MKLPDFRTDILLNEIKAKLGIPANKFAIFNPGVVDLTPAEEIAIRNGDGIDAAPEDIIFEKDGTFSFKGIRIVIYISNVSNYGGSIIDDLPRYHLLQCKTIREKKANGSFGRYVVNAEADGHFKINVVTNNKGKELKADLKVCQNCLAEVGFWGFSYSLSSEIKERIVLEFKPKDFFEAYPMSLFEELPVYDVESYPENIYSKDFYQIAERIKRIRNFTCEECNDFLRDEKFRRFLHVHHENMQKSDNRAHNLKVLCYECHSRKPSHSHMRNKLLRVYLNIKPRPPKSRYCDKI